MNAFRIARNVVVAGFALALGSVVVGPVAAAPVASITAAVKSAAASVTTEVRSRRHGWRRAYARGYGSSNSGCHIAGGYHRPNGCW
jgi:hypothetical protein